jgi:peptidyl-prolyl cis-trans isomerase C
MLNWCFHIKEAPKMKSFVLTVLFGGLLFGQAPQEPPPVPIAPGTPGIKPPTQATPPATPAPIAPDSVVIEVDGQKMTAAELDKLIAGMPPQLQQSARMQPQLLGQYFFYKKLVEEAEKAGLEKQSPFKETLEFNRLQVLAQAELTTHQNTMTISTEDQEKYYKDHPEKYREAKVRAIYVVFSPAGKPAPEGKKTLTEAEAKAKIEDLRKQIVAGGDFGKLARENSDDSASAAKDGDFGIIKPSSAYPEPVKAAVFKLKAGELSEPIRQPSGFYLLRLDELNVQPYNEVFPQIATDVRQERFNEWVKALQAQYKVKVENPAYFTPRSPAQLQQVR